MIQVSATESARSMPAPNLNASSGGRNSSVAEAVRLEERPQIACRARAVHVPATGDFGFPFQRRIAQARIGAALQFQFEREFRRPRCLERDADRDLERAAIDLLLAEVFVAV